MADFNKVFLIGRLTDDPKLRYTPGGAAVADMRLATSRTFTTKDGDRREDKLFIDVTVWNRQAENCCQYLKKGRLIHVEGYLKMDSWEDKTTGEKRSKIKVEAERVQFLDGGRREEADDSAPAAMADDDLAPRPSPRQAGPGNGASRSGGYPPTGGQAGPARRPAPPAESEDEDIPF
ncbi:MAG TPA: single-stranded DNA-binding protein [Isosphaeraceae bacterium]|jgi:single-strand DNA-binding protein|nr:single-stranded DNA-binding protein [Isosphaeraceae bacterium]